MAKSAIGRSVLSALCIAAAALGFAAVGPVPPSPDAPAQGGAPADPPPGQLLIASAQIQDPRFHHAVILILQHNQDGAFGIIINHPLAVEPISELLAAAGDSDKTAEGSIAVMAGGPVQPELGFVVHSTDYHRTETLAVDGKVAMTASREVLKDIGHNKGPQKSFFAFGYSGWGAGQLEGEIARRDWFTAPEDAELVFDADRNTVWDKALARHGTDL
ncbi:MAG TPA: YqgE/AlgH family protein [Stellaceae bacterium]|nr:YqgE/AlgH family protein [Stellaceae bacterium]